MSYWIKHGRSYRPCQIVETFGERFPGVRIKVNGHLRLVEKSKLTTEPPPTQREKREANIRHLVNTVLKDEYQTLGKLRAITGRCPLDLWSTLHAKCADTEWQRVSDQWAVRKRIVLPASNS